jgi:citronellol/citronellal dehydrogenase
MFISGASRGIGLSIAKRVAADGANIALVAKTAEPHPKLPGTIYTAAKQIEEAGGQALSIVGDVRDGESVAEAVAKAVDQFGAIEICVDNASAINLGSIEEVPLKRFDLMNGIQIRGTYAGVEGLHPAHEGPRKPAYPDAVTADSAGIRVAQADRLHDGKVRNDVVRVRRC